MHRGSHKELVKESQWMRVYRIGPNQLHYESKFLTDGLEVSPASIRSRWQDFTLDEQLDFALAFSAKPRFSLGDQEILTFLMESASDEVCVNIATRLPEHLDRERVLYFLLDRVARGKCVANYYQALELLNEKRAVPFLKQMYLEYKHKIAEVGITGLPPSDARDYLVCSKTLARLTGSEEFATAIEEMLGHPDARVKRWARQMFDDLRS